MDSEEVSYVKKFFFKILLMVHPSFNSIELIVVIGVFTSNCTCIKVREGVWGGGKFCISPMCVCGLIPT